MARPACVAGESMNARRVKKTHVCCQRRFLKFLFVSMGEPHGASVISF